MSEDLKRVHPNVDKSELRGRILGNFPQMRSSIDTAKNNYEIFKDIGVTPESLNDPAQRQTLISKMTSMRNALALEWHPDKISDKADQERFAKLQEAYARIKERKHHALDAQTNYAPHPSGDNFCTFNTGSNSFPLVYQIQNGFSLDDVVKEFKDFYEQQTGQAFDKETAAQQGYSYSVNADGQGNSTLMLSCPNMNTRNDCIQRLLDKNMIASPWQSLQEGVSADKESGAEAVNERPWLPRLEPAWAGEKS